ncbi:hypothetical protein BN2497_4585 [Janthinobacterium sp. CG23_2]|nr:hypothetical protein BN2497_4585 [Janthinobacterium sp. CG23_2]CUU28690.1 hypothetical protein BN3177_4585 [Janthinobacterium sp. CG23_2]
MLPQNKVKNSNSGGPGGSAGAVRIDQFKRLQVVYSACGSEQT